jgi:hypothetical protein
MGRRGLRIIFVSACAALLAGSAGCGSKKGNGCPPGADVCASYCQHLFSTVCAWQTTLLSCINTCHASMTSTPPDCVDAWEGALACGSCANVQCAQRTCTNGGTVCVQEESKIVGCDDENAAYRACAGACLKDPVSSFSGGSSFDGGTQSTEVVTSRCACPATLGPGAPAGTSCVTSGDCAQVCCACGTGHGKFLIRTCVNGQCLGDPDACASLANDFLVASFCAG